MDECEGDAGSEEVGRLKGGAVGGGGGGGGGGGVIAVVRQRESHKTSAYCLSLNPLSPKPSPSLNPQLSKTCAPRLLLGGSAHWCAS